MFKLSLIFTILVMAAVPADAKQLRILALGDSYTIGQGVEKDERWPEQLAQALRSQGMDIAEPVLIARSGWTSDDLFAQIKKKEATEPFDLVTLLIGANDQFQSRNTDFFRTDLSFLIKKAISFAGGNPSRVLLLSIPDWGKSPSARKQDTEAISREIDRYNHIIIALAEQTEVEYIDITELTRSGSGPTLYTEDELHPSAKMYSSWVVRILPAVIGILKSQRE